MMSLLYNIQHIQNMHTLRAPLNKLFKEDVKWNWSVDCQKALDNLMTALTSDLTLTHYDPNKKIYVASHPSNLGLRAIHKEKDGQLKTVHHAPRTLLPAEINYSQIEKGGFDLIFAVKKFRKYIHGREFFLQTNHCPLLSIFGSRKGIPTHSVNRLQRWGIHLPVH